MTVANELRHGQIHGSGRCRYLVATLSVHGNAVQLCEIVATRPAYLVPSWEWCPPLSLGLTQPSASYLHESLHVVRR